MEADAIADISGAFCSLKGAIAQAVFASARTLNYEIMGIAAAERAAIKGASRTLSAEKAHAVFAKPYGTKLSELFLSEAEEIDVRRGV